MKGAAFVRTVLAEVARERGDEGFAARRFGADSLPARIVTKGGMEALAFEKTTVAGGGTASGNWAELLHDAESAATEFFGLVRERSLLGRLGLRRVPMRIRLLTATDGFNAAWVGEGQPVPVSSAAFDEATLDPLKCSALTVVTEELLQSSDPSAEAVVRDDLVGAVVAAVDATFLDPANSGSAGVEPASVTNGAVTVNASGDNLDDLRLLIDALPPGADLERAVLIGSPYSFAKLHDPMVLPGLGVRGGNALGIPAFASKAAGDDLVLLDPDSIAYGTGSVDVRVSTQASIQMLDNPTNASATGTATNMVSLWQTNAAAVMATVSTNWQPARDAVAVLAGIDQS
jgi:hypothetical protein